MSKKVSSGYLSVTAEDVLCDIPYNDDWCVGYKSITVGKSPENVKAIKELKKHDMIVFYRGLMTEDGGVAGSGWCRSPKGNDYVEEFEL